MEKKKVERMVDNMLENFINNAEAHINRALHYAEKTIDANSKTEILNAEYCLGQYNAYLDMIKITDFDSYVRLAENNKKTVKTVLDAINKLYE